jgi:hypothetical protein
MVYIAAIPGFPVYQTVPADDMQIDTPNLHVRNTSWHALRFKAQFVHWAAFINKAQPLLLKSQPALH